MRNKRIVFSLLAGLLMMFALSAKAQGSADMAVYYLLTPTECAKKDQTVQFYPMNVGKATVNGFDARVYKNNELLFTEHVDKTFAPNAWDHVVLTNRVHLEYGEESVISLRIIAPDDNNASNDSTSLSLKMPQQMPYPFTWTEKNCRTYFHDSGLGTLDWQYDDGFCAYYMSDRSTNWMGTLRTDALEFPEGEAVKCSFEYGTSGGDVTLYFSKDYGDDVVEIDTVKVGRSTEDFTKTYYTFRAKGPALIRITASLGGEWNASGSIYLRNICFEPASKDMAIKSILQPADNVCIGGGDISVTARFTNPSADDIVNPIFCYNAGFGKVREVYEGTLSQGDIVDYTFRQTYTCSEECEKSLKVWCETDGDSDNSNDVLEKVVAYYSALEFPYITTFDKDNNLWTIVDVNGDENAFEFTQMGGGDMAAAFNNYAAEEVNELLISPAIHIPAGKHRVDFNYACYNMKGDVNLKLYMGRKPAMEEMTELLFNRDLRNIGWLPGYHLLDIQEDSDYYFAFVAKGKKDAVVIDNFKVDDGEDLAITDLRFNTESGYNLTQSTVTISYANYGLTPKQNVMLGYSVDDNEMVEEINPEIVMPGDTISYTFKDIVDLSEIDHTYTLVGMLLSDQGDEDINDIVAGWPVSNLKAKQLPYFNDFADEESIAQWLMTSNHDDDYSGWQHTYSWDSYSTLGVLKHENWSADRSDSWAYSDGIEMPAGEYEVSFFHHEANWFSGSEYLQDFEVYLGNQRIPESMNILVDRERNVDICDSPYQKIVKRVKIEQDGIYFLGLHNISAANYGRTYIDDISIEPVSEGLALPYTSDFESEDSLRWTAYDLNVNSYLQWANEDGAMVADRNLDYTWMNPEGMLVSPKLHLDADNKVKVTVNYEVMTTDESLSMNLYTGEVNNNSELALLATLPQSESSYTFEIVTADSPKDLYFGFRSNTTLDGSVDYSEGPFYTLRLNSLTVEYDAAYQGIDDVASMSTGEGAVYDLSGRIVANSVDAAKRRGLKGVFVVKNGSSSMKTILK